MSVVRCMKKILWSTHPKGCGSLRDRVDTQDVKLS